MGAWGPAHYLSLYGGKCKSDLGDQTEGRVWACTPATAPAHCQATAVDHLTR